MKMVGLGAEYIPPAAVQEIATLHGWTITLYGSKYFARVTDDEALDYDAIRAAIGAINALPELKAEKIEYLSSRCGEEILAGFDSDALGTMHHYDGGLEDQVNIVGAASGGRDIPFRCKAAGEDVKGFKVHNVAQMKQVFDDGADYKLAQLQKLENLRTQVEAAKTYAEIIAINW